MVSETNLDSIVTTKKYEDSGVLLQFSGDLDTLHVEEFRVQLEELLALRPPYIIADFKDLRYINSTGLGLLFQMSQRAAKQNCAFVLCEVNTEIREILNIVGVGPLLDIYTTRGAALASCIEELKV